MTVESYRDLKDGQEFDFVIVGSGFGGSVSALRLAEKGYSVAVLESGRHYRDEDFAKSNWDLPRYLWAPKFFLYGIQRLTLLKDILILSGAGVGGGSLVYANTLLEPGEAFYGSPEARRIDPDLRARLRPFYETAKRMLGAARVPKLFPADEVLREVAREMGREETFRAVDAGVFFGEPGKEVGDPYFDGAGPKRAGCIFCGGCMVGCRHNAKNTLMKNYLYLALAAGARVFSLATATRVEEREGGGFSLRVRRSGWGLTKKTIVARNLVLSAGVLGTLRLLLKPETKLPKLSTRVGRDVRTNSEELSGSSARSGAVDWSQGLAITSGMWPDEVTHVEAVRYSEGSDAMSFLAGRAPGTSLADTLRLFWPFGWAKRSTILLFMQTLDSRLRVRLKARRLTTEPEEGSAPPPRELPVAAKVLSSFARKTDGIAQVSLAGKLLGVSTTAHILGGAVIGRNAEEGVVGLDGKAFGYDDLWILDGTIVPGNLGVNPSLTITALAEHAMSLVRRKGGAA